MLISVGWLPPYLCPSRRLLRSMDEGRSLIIPSKVAPIPGLRLVRWFEVVQCNAIHPWVRAGGVAFRCQWGSGVIRAMAQAKAAISWVLTLPYRLRYRLAWDHALCRAVLGVYARVLLAFYARTARSRGIQDGRTGT